MSSFKIIIEKGNYKGGLQSGESNSYQQRKRIQAIN